MNITEDLQDIKDFVSLQSDEVQENCTIVTPSDMGVSWALHIDKNVPEEYIPRMPRSAMPSENDSCARVTVACTLLGCYIGYFRTEQDTLYGSAEVPNKKDNYKGGYVISKVPFDHGLKPNRKLVSDSDRFEEVWLVTYNEDHTEYAPTEIGKLFVSELKYLPVSGAKPRLELTFYIENRDPEGMWLDKTTKLGVGYYRLNVRWRNINTRSIFEHEFFQLDEIDESEYLSQKKRSADMLSYELPNKPKFMGW